MEMSMTFSSWSVYQVTILFNAWDVQTKSQFAISWLVVAFFAMTFHGLRFIIFMIEDYMHPITPSKPHPRSSNTATGDLTPTTARQTSQAIYNQLTQSEKRNVDLESLSELAPILSPDFAVEPVNTMSLQKYFSLRVTHAALSAVNYGLSLLLMLVAMTFNPSLLIALMVGYGFGDFLFFSRTRLYYSQSNGECH